MTTKTSELKQEINIPSGVEITLEKNTVHVKGPKGALSRTFSHPKIVLTKKENTLLISVKKSPHRREKALVGTFVAHVHNMIRGVTEGFEYRMKTLFSHFPIKTSVEGNVFVIQNFLGERSPRKAKILDGVTVTVQGDMVTLSGIDVERVGQTAVNIERATKVKKRDIRVFQDGVYITAKKGGKL